MTYEIGKILFVVLSKKNQVYPMRVVEVITKKSLKGEEVKYLLQAGSDLTTTVMLDQIDGEVFRSADEARNILTKRATSQVAKLVNAAVIKSKEWYGDKVETTMEPQPFQPEEESEQDDASVTLPDGTVAKVRMPTA